MMRAKEPDRYNFAKFRDARAHACGVIAREGGNVIPVSVLSDGARLAAIGAFLVALVVQWDTLLYIAQDRLLSSVDEVWVDAVRIGLAIALAVLLAAYVKRNEALHDSHRSHAVWTAGVLESLATSSVARAAKSDAINVILAGLVRSSNDVDFSKMLQWLVRYRARLTQAEFGEKAAALLVVDEAIRYVHRRLSGGA